jgi:hypothetical protein
MPSEAKNQNNDILQEGYFLMYKKIIKSGVWSDPLTLKIWIYCLARANFEDKKIIFGAKTHEIKRGQFITSTAKTAQDCNMSVKQVRSRWGALKSASKLAITGTNKYSVISVINYDKYQSRGQAEGQEDGKTKGNQRANKGQQINNINKINKKNIKDFQIYSFLSPEQQKTFCDKPEFVKYKLTSPADYDRILICLYLMEGQAYTNEIALKSQLKQDRNEHARELEQIAKCNDNEYMQIMANMRGNGRLSLANVAMACKSKSKQNTVNTGKTDKLKQELAQKMKM